MKIKTIVLLAFVLVMFMPAGVMAEPVLKVQFDIMKNGTVDNFHASVINARANPKDEGNCVIMIQDADGNPVWSTGQDVNFGFLDAQVPSGITILKTKIPYSKEMKKLSVFYEGEDVFETPLIFCNNNRKCGSNENYLSCPHDCPENEKDGICINDNDGVCDPDCIEGYDPDCIKNEENACGDGFCDVSNNENFANCPQDCKGKRDGICDRWDDGMCDPDCGYENDIDCRKQEKQKQNPFIFPLVMLIVISLAAFVVIKAFRKTKNIPAEAGLWREGILNQMHVPRQNPINKRDKPN